MNGNKKFLIVGTQRTGSSAIAEMIGLHPDVACGWEWTQNILRPDKVKLAERGLSGDVSWLDPHNKQHADTIMQRNTEWFGFRRLFRSSDKWLIHPKYSPALYLDRFDAHINWLRKRPDILLLHVTRRDNAEWIKSKVLAKKNNAFFGAEYNQERKVSVNITEAIKRITSKKWVDLRLSELGTMNRYMEISYEDFLADNQSVISHVHQFMGCQEIALPTKERKLAKQSTKDTREYIENYDAFINALESKGLRFG